MGKIRVLVVDDSVVVRRLVSDVLTGDPDIEVVGTAANGRLALAKLTQVNPELVTLDIEMPEMDGLQTLAALRKTHPKLPVIMFSTLTQRGALSTLDALALGANDYVTKPSQVENSAMALQRIRDELVPKIKLFCGNRPQATATARTLPFPPPRPAEPLALRHRVDVVAIGVSTGGPNALAEVLPALSAQFPVPIVIVQHMPPLFTRFLAERLAAKSAIPVREGAAGESLQGGAAWLAPGDYHMTLNRAVKDVRLVLTQGPPENSCRPAVDVLFRSVAEIYGAGVLAVVLTGMGQDGLRGCEKVREAGGQVIVQDEASSVVWGMPGFVARAGLAHNVLPLNQIAAEIVRRVGGGSLQPASSAQR